MVPVEIEQKKGGHTIKFVFRDDVFDYTASDRTGMRSVTVPYLSLNASAMYSIIERKEWYRNAGYLWLLIGIAFVVTHNPSGAIFILLGGGCVLYYRWAVTSFLVVPSDRGNIFLIEDDKKAELLKYIGEGQKRMMLRNFGAINYERSFEEEKHKYRHLLEQQHLTQEEFNSYLKEMEENKSKFKS